MCKNITEIKVLQELSREISELSDKLFYHSDEVTRHQLNRLVLLINLLTRSGNFDTSEDKEMALDLAHIVTYSSPRPPVNITFKEGLKALFATQRPFM